MSDYASLRKLDEDSLRVLKEGTGPVDQCICSVLAPPSQRKKSIKDSIKKAFGTIGAGLKKGKDKIEGNVHSIEIPLSFTKGSKGIKSTKEIIKRKSSCGKCGCDSENIVLKHSVANIEIISPDISSVCPCPSSCLPEANKLHSNIKVTIERVDIVLDTNAVNSGNTFINVNEGIINEKGERRELERESPKDLTDAEYEAGYYKQEDFEDSSDPD